MPRRTKTISKSRSKTRSRKTRTKTNSRSKSNSRSKTNSKSRRKYRGGCKTCAEGTGAWKSTSSMYGGSNPYQISKDIFSHVTNTIPYSVA